MNNNLSLFEEPPEKPSGVPSGSETLVKPHSQQLNAPLAETLRPNSLDEVVGQEHLLGEGKPLRTIFESGKLHSLILWGPPGVGKTTLARLLAKASNAHFIALSAVFSGVKDIREAVETAKTIRQTGKGCTLFVDEIHRFNKSQQDALLPYVESGLVTFIGATTENPSFEVNSALLSRSQVYVLQSLTEADFAKLFQLFNQRTGQNLNLSEKGLQTLSQVADGDARRFMNAVELLAQHCRSSGQQEIDHELVHQTLPETFRRFDKGGDQFYDQISALHKSVRGSDPDAALYWFARMLDGGTDPRYLARRLVRMAWEDIGLADPRAMTLANEAAATYERLGSPEGELALAETVVYLAIAAKSNAAYSAYNAARAFVKETGTAPVPMHLRNAPTKLMKELGHGEGYRYAHNEEQGHAAGENYWPDNVPAQSFYQPVDRGLEQKITEKMNWLRQRNSKES